MLKKSARVNYILKVYNHLPISGLPPKLHPQNTQMCTAWLQLENESGG